MGAIKNTELRIGNLLKTDNSTDHYTDIIVVKEITESGINLIDSCGNGFEEEWEFEGLTGIIITKEWLVKCGFKYNDTNNMYFLPIPNLKCEIHATLFRGGFVIELQNHLMPIVTECYFVHDIQNLYFALTKKELNHE